VILYHFTSPERLARIQGAGVLRTTESNIGSGHPDWRPYGEHIGPDVVWLTDDQSPDGRALALDLQIDGTDKMAVRITVDVDEADVWWWPDFALHHGAHRKWRRLLGQGRAPESWWVHPAPIPVASFLAVEARASESVA